ncbi:hypothetical protein Zmor_022148 [Zophobas morio]|uniref:THAP-type domain-containing protein n=1 Tax=Zophobas morio TaxID=2755281 RepID=A0AA38HVR4_9CUCU|nr:hypothetical protein Zmor_022148 [Zophobas morio]
MPRRCCVPACKSNYDSEIKKTNTTVTTFSFPKDPARKNVWIRAIPRKDWTPSATSAVCINHFNDRHVVKYQVCVKPNGERQQVLLKYPKLTKDAVPQIFKNLPGYLSVDLVPERKDPEQRRIQLEKQHAAKIEQFLLSDNINGYDNFVNNFKNHLQNLSEWSFKVVEDGVWCYVLNIDHQTDCEIQELTVVCSVNIRNDLGVKVFVKGNEISYNDLRWLFTGTLKLTKWSQFENLLLRYKNVPHREDTVPEHYINKAYIFLEKAHALLNDDHEYKYKKYLDSILQQLKMLCQKKSKYSSSVLLFAFMIYSQSVPAYNILRDYFFLPHKRYLQQLSSGFNVSTNDSTSTTHYIEHLASHLTEREKYVALLIDEIYVHSHISFKNNNIVGMAENHPTQAAKTVVTFMITAVFGNFKEVVRLYPVNNLTGEELKHAALETINVVQKCDFKVILIITDNNRLNQNFFKNLVSGDTFCNPLHSNMPIFLTYDFVHLFKNIYNNWLNRKDNLKTFTYPDFNNFEHVKQARLEHIRIFYNQEKELMVKKAFKLNRKTLYPNNFERQNVKLSDNVFHDTTIAALKTIPAYHETADFLQIIRNWWDIVNTKNIVKGIAKRNRFSGPIHSMDDEKIQFLKKFLLWLEKWSTLNKDGLSKDTASALFRSTSILLKFAEYSLTTLKVNYILPEKCETDNLEERFGLYRRLSGSNYHVSVRQILESEKKCRLRRLFQSVGAGTISLKDALNYDVSEVSDEDISDFAVILEDSFHLEEVVPDEAVQNYICGYVSHSVLKSLSCSLCEQLLRVGKGCGTGDVYFDHLQRGGLSVPSHEIKYVFNQMASIFQFIITSEDYEKKFFQYSNHKNIITKLTMRRLQENDFF